MPDLTGREAEVWRKLWRTPQAYAWAAEEWRWHAVALYTRWAVRAESETASAAILAQVVRLSDQVGLSPAGLVENSWRVAEPQEEAAKPSSTTLPDGRPTALDRARQRSRSRFRTADGYYREEADDANEPPDPRSALTREYRAPSMRERLAALGDDAPVTGEDGSA